MTKKETKKDTRARAWTIVVYPESLPEDWREKLDNLHIKWCESLHDKDENPNHTKKKAHIHVVLVFSSKKSFAQVKEIADKLNAPVPQKVNDIRGMIRYLIHLDNPEKHQYPKENIKLHGGIDIEKYFQATAGTKREILKNLIDTIRNNHITNFSDFIAYVMENEDDAAFDVVTQTNTMVLQAVINGEYQKSKTDLETTKLHQSEISKSFEVIDNIAKAKEMKKLGKTNKEIADTLGKSTKTIQRYLKK